MDLDEAINKYTPTAKADELKKILFDIWDDKEFMLGVLMDLKTDEHRQRMIDLIEKEGIDDSSTITLAALDIRNGEI